MLKNIFGKKKKKEEQTLDTKKKVAAAKKTLGGEIPEITDEMIDMMLEGKIPGMPKVGPMQKMAIKSLKKMDPQKRKEVFAEAMGKMQEKGGESNDEMAKQIEEMKNSGVINSKQYKIARKKLGLE